MKNDANQTMWVAHSEICRMMKVEAEKTNDSFIPTMSTFDADGPRIVDMFTIEEETRHVIAGEACLLPQFDTEATLAIATIDAFTLEGPGETPEDTLEGYDSVASHPNSHEALVSTIWEKKEDGTWEEGVSFYDPYTFKEGEGLVWDLPEPKPAGINVHSMINQVFLQAEAYVKKHREHRPVLEECLAFLQTRPHNRHLIGILRADVASSLDLPLINDEDGTEFIDGS